VAGAVAQQPGLLDLQPRLGDLLPHDALVGERTAERHPALGPGDHQCQRPLRCAQGAHAVVDPARAEPCLRGGKTAALLTDHVGHRHPGTVEADLGVPVLVVVTEHRVVPDDGDPCRVGRDDDHRLLTVGRSSGVGLAHDDQHGAARVHRSTGPPLSSGDDVLVAVPLDPGGDVGRVAAGDVRLGHREGGPDLAGQQRLEPAALLLLGAEQVKQLHVAGVRGLAVDRLGRQVVAPPRQLGDRRVLQLRQPRLGR